MTADPLTDLISELTEERTYLLNVCYFMQEKDTYQTLKMVEAQKSLTDRAQILESKINELKNRRVQL